MYIRFGILCHMLIFSIYLSYSLIFSQILLNALISSFFLTFHLSINQSINPDILPISLSSPFPPAFSRPAPTLSYSYQKIQNNSAVNRIKRSFLRYYCPIIGFSSVLNICIYRLYQSIIYIMPALYPLYFVHCMLFSACRSPSIVSWVSSSSRCPDCFRSPALCLSPALCFFFAPSVNPLIIFCAFLS